MAHSKSFFGLRRGSTKSLTFQVLDGQQITKDRVEKPRNPRTAQQMWQRMLMATISAMYSSGKQIFDHSFAGYSYGLKNMGAFMSRNLDRIKTPFGVDNAGYGYCDYRDRTTQPGSYQVSEGSLPPTTNGVQLNKLSPAANVGTLLVLGPSGDPTGSYVRISDHVAQNGDAYEFDIAGFAQAYGIPVDGYLTIIALVGNNPEDGYQIDTEFGFARLHYPTNTAKVVLSGEDATARNKAAFAAIRERMQVEVLDGFQASFTPSEDSSDWNEIQVWFNAMFADYTELKSVLCYAVIASQKQDKVWQRSTEFFQLPSYIRLNEANTAFSTYPVETAKVLNGGDPRDAIEEV